jgi:hypothetical protein
MLFFFYLQDIFWSIAHSLFLVLQDTAASENLNIQLIIMKEMARRGDTWLMQQLSLVQHLYPLASIIM